MDVQLLILFICLTVVAEIFGTVGGFGSSVFFVPLAGYFIDFYSVLGITVLFHILSNLTKIAFFRSGIDRRILLLIGAPSVVMVILGAWLTIYFETKILQMLLGIFLIIMSLFFLARKKFELAPSSFNALVGGGISGLVAGLVGTGGAIRGMTMAAFNLPKSVFIATSASIDLMVDVSRSFVYFNNGFIHKHDLYLIPFLFGASIIGTWIGKKLLNKIPQNQFRTIVLSLIFLIGVVSLIEYFRN